MKAPAAPRNKRLLNMLASVAVCAGLMIAYYVATGQEPIPADAHVSFEHGKCPNDCLIYRIDVMADGAVTYQASPVAGPSEAVRYNIPKSEVRRLLRSFKQARFFDTDITRYSVGPDSAACYLSVTAGHQKTSVLDQCDAKRPEFAAPMAALQRATHYQAFIDHDQATIARLGAVPVKPVH